MIDQHLNGIKERVFPADRGNRLFTPIIRVKIHRVAMHNSIPQFGRPAHRRVLAEIALDGINGGIFYVLRRREVRLTRAEVHNIYSLLTQLVSFGDNGHGGGRFDSVDSLGKFEFGGRCCNWSHARFLVFDFLVFSNFTAGSSFSRNLCSTISGTRSAIDPPSFATSRTSRELR